MIERVKNCLTLLSGLTGSVVFATNGYVGLMRMVRSLCVNVLFMEIRYAVLIVTPRKEKSVFKGVLYDDGTV